MPLLALTLALAAQGQLYYPLKWEPKRGETHVYELFIKDKDTSVEASVEHKVTQVGKDGSYTVQSRSLGALVRVAGSEIRDDRPNEAIASFDDRGRLKEIKGGSAGLEKYRSALLMRFVCNEASGGGDIGAAWTYERPKDAPKGLPGCKVEYTIAAYDSTTKLVRVNFVFTELGGEFPQTATGSWWIHVDTRLPHRLDAKVKNFAGSQSAETEVKLALRKPA